MGIRFLLVWFMLFVYVLGLCGYKVFVGVVYVGVQEIAHSMQ